VLDPLDQQDLVVPDWLRAVPAGLVDARSELHRLAEQVISPARREATGKIGLRATPGGFGTPRFGDGQQLRVEGTELVVVGGDIERSRSAVAVDSEAAAFLADWLAFGASLLLELRAEGGPGADPSLIQLWPEHFDIAVELGSEAAGARATYGFSPGDDEHPEPYVYVSAWQALEPGPLWNATAFPGAELPYAVVQSTAQPRAVALAFLRERLQALTG
jgi:hypothetical protein